MNVYQSIIAANSGVNAAVTANKPLPSTSKTSDLDAVIPSTPVVVNKPVIRQGDRESYSKAEQYFQQKQSHQDQPNAKNQKVLEQYGMLAKEDKRAEVQLLMGVDTFA